jgi:hypothetical protein
MRRTAVVIVAALVCGGFCTVEAAEAAVMCRHKSSFIVTVRGKACKKNEAKVDIAQFLGAGAIAGDKLADGAVTGAKLGDGAVTGVKLADASVTEPKLAAGVAPKFLSLNVFGTHLGTTATFATGFGPNAGIIFPDNSTGDLAVGFTIPPDYTPGTPLVVRFLWHTTATACEISFRANSLSVARAGRNHLVGPGSVSAGMTVVGGELLAAPAVSNQTNETLMTIVSPVAGTDLAPGDAINFGMFRSGAAGTDTCGAAMTIQGLGVEYQ